MPASQVREASVEDFAVALEASGDVVCEVVSEVASVVVEEEEEVAEVVVEAVSGMLVPAATSLTRTFTLITLAQTSRLLLLLLG
jgi:dihydrodipicolinate synthase/N-acetylneuraminate lyase